jgi:hypothetical protein
MGKYTNSDIYNRYSDWHYDLIKKNQKYKDLFMCDIDRFFIEVDKDKKLAIAAFDLKYDNNIDTVSFTEEILYKWLEKNGCRVYIIYISKDFKIFKVQRFNFLEKYILSEIQYADWLLRLRTLLKISPITI